MPIALASIIGGPLGGKLFERHIANPVAAGTPPRIAAMWLIIVAIGVVSIVGLYVYDRLIAKPK